MIIFNLLIFFCPTFSLLPSPQPLPSPQAIVPLLLTLPRHSTSPPIPYPKPPYPYPNLCHPPPLTLTPILPHPFFYFGRSLEYVFPLIEKNEVLFSDFVCRHCLNREALFMVSFSSQPVCNSILYSAVDQLISILQEV